MDRKQLEEALAGVDEETFAAAMAVFDEQQAELTKSTQAIERSKALKANASFVKTYPRAMKLIAEGKMAEPDVSAEELEDALKAEEERLVSFGVPDPTVTPTPEPAPTTPQGTTPPPAPPGPADGWGGPLNAGVTPAPGSNEALKAAMDAGDFTAIIREVHALQKEGKTRDIRMAAAPYMDETPIMSVHR